jgi:hypothetical protein
MWQRHARTSQYNTTSCLKFLILDCVSSHKRAHYIWPHTSNPVTLMACSLETYLVRGTVRHTWASGAAIAQPENILLTTCLGLWARGRSERDTDSRRAGGLLAQLHGYGHRVRHGAHVQTIFVCNVRTDVSPHGDKLDTSLARIPAHLSYHASCFLGNWWPRMLNTVVRVQRPGDVAGVVRECARETVAAGRGGEGVRTGTGKGSC